MYDTDENAFINSETIKNEEDATMSMEDQAVNPGEEVGNIDTSDQSGENPEGSDTAVAREDGGHEAEDGSEVSETSAASVKKTRRTKKTAASNDASDEAQENKENAEEEKAPAEPHVSSATERARENAERRRRRARERQRTAMLDAEGNPIIDGDGTFDDDVALIHQVKNTRRIVSGTIDEVKMGRGETEGWVEVIYNGFRVLIPFSQMGINFELRPDEEAENLAARLRTTIANMLGARIDFVINGVDADTRLATGSRAQACAMKRRDILNATDGEGNYNVYPGRAVQASVLAVHPRFAFIDVFGYRTRLRAKDIRSEYTEDVADVLENGQIIKVYVTHIARDPMSGEVTELFVSMRNDIAEKAELERVAAGLKEGDTCRGRVSNRTRNAIFIRLNNGLQAFVYISGGLQGRSIPNVGDSVSVRVIRKVQNNNNGNPFIQGRIVRNIKYNAR